MAIKIDSTFEPNGSFKLMDTQHVSHGASTLSEVIDAKAEASAVTTLQATKISLNRKDFIISRNRNMRARYTNYETFKFSAFGDSICAGSGASAADGVSAYEKGWHWRLTVANQSYAQAGTYAQFGGTIYGIPSQDVVTLIPYVAYDLDTTSKYAKNSPILNPTSASKFWVIMTGRNDCITQSLSDFEYFYRMIVRVGIRHGKDVLCFTEPPMIDTATGNVLDGSSSSYKYPDYAESIRKIAREENASLVDVYNEFLYRKNVEGVDLRTLMNDQVHPNNAGHQIIADMAYSCLLMPDTTHTKSNRVGESKIYKYIPQFVGEAINTSSASKVTNYTLASTSSIRGLHLGVNDLWKISSGGSIDFSIPPIPNRIILVTVVLTLGTGTLTVEAPTGLSVKTGLGLSGPLCVEKTYVIRPTSTDYPPSQSMTLKAVGGDVYVSGVTVINPSKFQIGTKDAYTETGTWADAEYVTGKSGRKSSTATDKKTIKWIGSNIAIRLGAGTAYGQCTITTDGGTAKTIDCYSGTGATNILVNAGENLELGVHTTVIEVLGTKNASASAVDILVADCEVYSMMDSDNNAVFLSGANISTYLAPVVHDYIEGGDYTIDANKVVTTTGTQLMKTKRL